ncbi:Pectate lyase [Rhizoctonia solani]|uniref:Pectate lyase n=1 Tax=Rhizoctonia solani TaxID=456999 RepID=A0A8H7M5V1_9AGAM|nr:Pectate lyase [Rhizoctonia solani]
MYAVFYIAVTAFISSLVVAAPSSTAPQGHIDEFVRRDADAPPFVKRAASCTFPIPPKTSSLSSPITVTGTFDGGHVRFDRGSVACTEQAEGGDADTAEVVHCLGPCNLYNVWFEDVCEDAITIKQTSGQSNIIGGGAKSASNKVVQHNGAETVKIDSYCVQSFGKLYRSCGNCSTQYKHTVLISQIIGKAGSSLAGTTPTTAISPNSTPRLSLSLSSVSSICDTYQGNSSGDEPTKLTSNASNA